MSCIPRIYTGDINISRSYSTEGRGFESHLELRILFSEFFFPWHISFYFHLFILYVYEFESKV